MSSLRSSGVGMRRAGASQGASVALASAALALGPLALATAALTVYVVTSQLRWHWTRAGAAGAVSAGAVGLMELVVGLNPLALHFSGFLGWLGHGLALDVVPILQALATTIPLGVPVGVAIGAAVVGVGEARATGAEWHPLEQRRLMVGSAKRERALTRLLTDSIAQARCSVPPLGVARDGDLDSWREGPYTVMPDSVGSLGLGVVGASGSGKTVTLERLVTAFAARGRRVVFADCKGTDPELPRRIAAAYQRGAGRRGVRILNFPETPMDGWLGQPNEVANRYLAVTLYTDPYYGAVAQTGLRAAVGAPDDVVGWPCKSSSQFLARLTPDVLRRAYSGTSLAHEVAALVRRPEPLDGLLLRYSGFFVAVNGSFDGQLSFGDADLVLIKVPTLEARDDAGAVMKIALADLGHYMTARKPRQGDDVSVIIDEFSAVTDAAPLVIDLAERVRDVGGQVIVAAQSYEGLGTDDAERRRMIGALGGGMILHRCIDPDELLRAGGTVRKVEQSWQVDDVAHSGLGSMRMAHGMRVDPDAVRQAHVGEAWVISNGRSLHMSVIPPGPTAVPPDVSAVLVNAPAAEQVAARTRDGAARSRPDSGPLEPPLPSFLDELDDPTSET